MKVLIKLGGTLLDSPDTRNALAHQIARLPQTGCQVVVVHGGGKRLSRHLAAQGVESRFVNGLRVTTPQVLQGVVQVLAGEVNTELVGALEGAGARAVGLTGADAGLAEAAPLSPELGAVGRVERVRAAVLDLLTAAGYLPTVACLARGAGGELYNVNADQMAAALACGFQAHRFILLTDVEGVLDSSGRLIPELTREDAEHLIQEAVASGGMEAKLRACCTALRHGLPQVSIAAGATPGVLERLLAGQSAGTTLTPAPRGVYVP